MNHGMTVTTSNYSKVHRMMKERMEEFPERMHSPESMVPDYFHRAMAAAYYGNPAGAVRFMQQAVDAADEMMQTSN